MTEPRKFRKKPVEIEAMQFVGGTDAVQEWVITQAEHRGKPVRIYFDAVDPEDRTDDPEIVAEVWDELHSTWVGVKRGQWIICGVQGEFYPCDPDVFEATYEPIEESS